MADTLNLTELGLFYMFEQPSLPLFIPRASNTVVYNIPSETLAEGVSVLGITNRFGGGDGTRRIAISNMISCDDLPLSVRLIERGTPFINFLPSHMRAAKELTDLLMNQKTPKDVLSFAANIHDCINETLFIYCLSFVVIRRKDLRRVRVPSFVETMPSNFLPVKTIEVAQREVNRRKLADVSPERIVIEHDLDFSGTALKLEHRVSYWREDYGINNHHWHWHLVFPLNMNVNKDRKGELFFYMHNQMLARYDWERLSNGLTRVKPITSFREPIEDGYFSKLTVNNSSQTYGSRQDNTKIRDFTRRSEPIEPFTVNDLEIWRQRLFDGIHQGFFIDRQGNRIPLSDDVDILAGEKYGIDLLGDAFEADTELSINGPFYGNLHNFAHVIISAAHDPDGSHKENLGVMSSTATAMRDPVFYRLHRFVDDVFQAYKLTQRPYNDDELLVIGVEMKKIGIATGSEGNILTTFYDTRLIEASRGIDFGSEAPLVDVNLTRLNHAPFKYHFVINNSTRADKRVTVRVYMAPKFNESGSEMSFMDQRNLWAEMDKFTYTLTPGSNLIQKQSIHSSITIPEDLTFRELEAGIADKELSDAFCGCGWPQHMLVPRGTAGGMAYQIFVLLSDYELDKVSDSTPTKSRCGKAVSYCGLLDDRFPDRRPMGYPFDRRPLPEIDNMTKFADRYSNARLIDITIQFRRTDTQPSPST